MNPDTQPTADNEKGVPEIQVTPEMIEAAYRVWQDSGATDYVSDSDKLMLHEIIVAALEVRGPVGQMPQYALTSEEMTPQRSRVGSR